MVQSYKFDRAFPAEPGLLIQIFPARDRVYGGEGVAMSPTTFGQGGDIISFVHPQHFEIKSNVFVQISRLHYCWKPFPQQKTGINEKNEHHQWIICRHSMQISYVN